MSERVIIIGSGPAGLTAAIYLGRAQLSPLLFEGFQQGGIPGGQLMTTDIIENFPGFPEGIEGHQLIANVHAQAERFGTRFISEDIVNVDLSKLPFTVYSDSGQSWTAQSLIIATGARAKRLSLSSEKKLWGRGISACAICDGALPLFRNKPLAVIGGGDSALEEAIHLSKFGSSVHLIHRRDALRASKIMQEKIGKMEKISLHYNTKVVEFLGDKLLSGLLVEDTITGARSELSVSGAFEAIGHEPNTGFLGGQLTVDEKGYLVVSSNSTMTSITGVFAAGDVQDPKYRQAISAAGSGCIAALDCERWLQENE